MKLVIATPSRGQVSLSHRDLFSDIKVMCRERDVEFDVFDDTTNGELHASRNLLLFRIAEELDDEDWAYWLDADVSHAPQLLFDLLPRSEEIIARSYPIKPCEDEKPGWSAYPIMIKNRTLWGDDGRLVACTSHGFGSVVMKASAAKKLRDKYGVRGRGGQGKRSIPAFDLRVNAWNTECGEDVSFCDRWREEMGEKLWVAPDGYIRNGAHGGEWLDELKPFGVPG